MSERADYDCVVVGGGPGGLVAALYLARYKRRTALVDAGAPRAEWIPKIRNLIGYADGISGPQLLERLRRQLAKVPVDVIDGRASVRRAGRAFDVTVGRATLRAKSVIIATGMRDVQPPVSNVDELRRKGLLAYCAICDGYDHADDEVALLVDGSGGLAKMRFMAALTPKLHVVQTKHFTVSPFHQHQIARLGLTWHRSPLASLAAARNGARLIVRLRNAEAVRVRVAYVELGTIVDHTATQHLRGLSRTRAGFIVTSSHQETSVPRLYAVGDCVNSLSQVSVAVGHAAIAATRAHHDLGL